LDQLEDEFSEEEMHGVTHDLEFDKAPSSDWFIEVFLKSCWPVVKEDLMSAANFFSQHDQHFSPLA